MKFTLELHRKVYCDEDGSYYRIKPDSDGFGCVELSYVDEHGKPEIGQVLDPYQAKLIAEAMIKCADELIEQSKE